MILWGEIYKLIGEFDIVIRLIVSFFMGGLVGYERQSRNKSAGLRTHILVCLGSSLIMILSVNIYASVQGLTNADPARLAAQVISGIGFLGAGTIMKEGATVRGLTTAASLWVVSAIGLAIGFGYFFSAIVCTIMVVFALTLLPRCERLFQRCQGFHLIVDMVDCPGQISKIAFCLGSVGVSICDIRVEGRDHHLSLDIILELPNYTDIIRIVDQLMNVEGVLAVKQE